MSDKEKSIEVLEWKQKADEDFTACNTLLESDFILETIICFHFQQAAEKYLKTFFILNGVEIEKIHNLEVLQNMAIKMNSDFGRYDFKNLTDYSVQFRYPTTLPLPTMAEIDYFKKVIADLKAHIEELL
ncbi:MAG: HEPN domain-containing protein [Bacteroidia bacterium]